MHRMDRDDEHYVAAFERCLACEAIEVAQREQAKRDTETTITAGRLWRVYTRDEALQLSGEGRTA